MVGKDLSGKKEKRAANRHQPLHSQLEQDKQTWKPIKERSRTKKKSNVEENVVGDDLSGKILDHAREQLEEEEMHDLEDTKSKNVPKFTKKEEFNEDELSDDEDFDIQELEEITEEDERALEMFMSREPSSRQTLADIIMEKIREKEEGLSQDQLDEKFTAKFDPKVVQVYQGVGKLLSTYTAGKIPKAFKIIPALSNWEEILFLTSPDSWSAVAVRQATRLFASNLNMKMAQRFYNLILLPRVIDDIENNKKLNYHLYLALKKSLYKPAAFYKGILLPLCESGQCTLREATIIGSVLSKVSVPVLHSSAAILKIAEMDYSGANSLFLRVLLQKKYALPYRVIDALVNHFTQFTNDTRKLPILWHQALLTFVQRYRTDLLPEQKEALKVLIRHQVHPYFSDEIRRELLNSKSRGDKVDNVAAMEMN